MTVLSISPLSAVRQSKARFAAALVATLTLSAGAFSQTYNPATADWTNATLPAAFRVDTPNLVPIGATVPTTSGTSLNRDPSLDDLATALGHDVDRIFELISNEVRTSPGFGLTKGAFGVSLDLAGNPFDQAHFMVELLRSSDANAATTYNPRYVYGTVSLSGTEFGEVFGVSTARGACELLASAGVPASVNGSTQACSAHNASTSATTVDFRHVWVRASIDGVDYDFDPSLKTHEFHASDSNLLGGVPSATTLRNGVSGGTLSGTNVAISSGQNSSSLASTLSSAVTSVRAQIETSESATVSAYDGTQSISVHQPLAMEEVIGGFGEIVRVERYSSFQAQRVTSLTGHTASNVWSEIPDELRTYVHMRITANANVGSMELSYPAADLAGRRIWVAEDNVMTPGVPSDAATITMNVLIDEVLALKPNGQPATFDADTGYGTHGNQIDIEVAIHHPIFTVSGGEAATATSSYEFEAWNAFPSYFAFGFGERGTRAQVRNTAAVPNSGLASWPNDSECLPGNWGAQCSFVLRDTFSAQMNSQVTSAEAFLKHASDLGDLVAGASGGRHVNLHSVAMASMFVELNTAQAPYSQCNSSGCGTIPYDGLLAPKLSGQRLVVDVTSRSGFAGYDAGASDRDVFASTYAAMLVGTEQAILQSNTDNPSIGTPPAMFEWFADASRSEAFNASANSSYQIRFVEIPAGLGTQAREDGLDAIWHGPNSPVANSLFGQEYGDFNLISPQSGRVGPLRASVRVNDPQDPASEHEFVDLTTCSANCTIETFDAAGAYRTRMSGFVAVQNTASGIAIAPIGLSGLKGGGGATFPDSIEPPTADRESLDEAYESWATAFSVDGRTGGLTLTPPADITTGAGGNPYSLGFQRSYSSDNLSDGVLGVGWTHNWSARLSTSTDIDAALGGQSPHQGLATIVAIQALHNLFETPSSDIQDLPTAMLIANWWSGQVFDNTATISRGAESERFYLQPDGVWAPQPGSFASLSRTGTRTAEANQTVPEPGDSSTYNPRIVAESFNRSGWSFTYEGPDGTTESFTYGFDLSTGNYDPRLSGLRAVYHSRSTNAIGSSSSFLRRSTSRIAAPDTAYVYEQVSESGRYVGELLREVSNGAPFGRHIYLDYYLWQGSDGIPADPYAETGVAGPDSARSGPVARRLQYVRDENGTRQVSFGYDGFGYLVSATDILGNVTTYQYDFDFPVANTVFAGGIYQDRDLLTSLRLPHDPNNNFISITYTDEGRTQSVAERDGHTTQYFVAAGSRARSRNPAGTDSFSYYDRDGRQFANQIIRASWARHQDRVIRNHFDAWGRTTYTEGGYVEDLDYLADRNETYYDQLSNTVLTRSLGGTNASGVPLTTNVLETVTEYGYAPFPNLPTVQIDSNGNATTTCYERTSVAPCNSNAIQDPTVPDGLPRATYGAEGEESLIEYDSLGRVTRQRVRIEN